MFGLGWGASGMCPGPAFVAAAYGYPQVALVFLPSMAVGMKVRIYERLGVRRQSTYNLKVSEFDLFGIK